jgi:hypothetical protein
MSKTKLRLRITTSNGEVEGPPAVASSVKRAHNFFQRSRFQKTFTDPSNDG